MITVERETIDQFRDDAQALFEKDWEETTDNGIEFDIDVNSYRNLEKSGCLLIVAARNEGSLVGYICFILGKSMHHKKAMANCCGLYVAKENRGKTGTLLVKKAIELLKLTDICKIRISSSTKNDISKFLEHFGFKPEETIHGLIIS